MSEEVRITYETLYEMLRNEKQKDELQKLPLTFFTDVTEYLEEKKKILNNENKDLFTESELEKTRVQINNIRKMIKELFDRREKKLIILAMNMSRTENMVYDKSLLLDTEKKYFVSISNLFKSYRDNIVKRISNGLIPKDMKQEVLPEEDSGEKPKEQVKKVSDMVPKDYKLVRFLYPVPKFVGPDGNVFGPYEPEDMANLPEKVVGVLVRKGRAEEIES
ncbi:hypothetical protein C0585_05030 [Candidatus Woesearchaeota archaeon]|nr:MAG: hypothetical protein C0585_05030 [Candidatus Woesearchaeota archaeon]